MTETSQRVTRSQARALSKTPSVAQRVTESFRAATAGAIGRARGKKADAASSPDVASNLFSKGQADDAPSADAQQIGDQGSSMHLPAPATPAAPPAAAAGMQQANLPTPSMQLSPVAPHGDDMAISPAPCAMDQERMASATPDMGIRLPFGTPIEVSLTAAASPMQLTPPAMPQHAAAAADLSAGLPQQPMEELSFELPPGAQEEEVAPTPMLAAPEAAEPAAAEAAALLPAPAAVVAAAVTLPATPTSTGLQGAAARLAAKPPPSLTKPGAGAMRSPAQRVPLSPSMDGSAKAPEPAAEAKTPSPAAPTPEAPTLPRAMTPAAAPPPASAASAKASTGGVKPIKRVSIATPVPSGPRPSAAKPIVRTPYPRSGSRTPVAVQPSPVPSGSAADVQQQHETEEQSNDAAADEAGGSPAADAMDAAMLLAAARRNTCEGSVADEAVPEAAPAPAAGVPLAAATPEFGFRPAPTVAGDGMDVDGEEDGTPEFRPLAASSSFKANKTPVAKPFATPKSLKKDTVPRTQQHEDASSRQTPPSAPKLTIPIASGSASYMAATKSFEQKARLLQVDTSVVPAVGGGAAAAVSGAGAPAAATAAATAASARPRVKSEVVGRQADDRSMKQLKREIKAAMAEKEKKERGEVKGLESDDDEMGEAPYSQADEAMLVNAMSGGKMQISAGGSNKRVVLKGLPAPQGTHLRFRDDGKAAPSPSGPSKRVVLKGMPAPTGTHKRFE